MYKPLLICVLFTKRETYLELSLQMCSDLVTDVDADIDFESDNGDWTSDIDIGLDSDGDFGSGPDSGLGSKPLLLLLQTPPLLLHWPASSRLQEEQPEQWSYIWQYPCPRLLIQHIRRRVRLRNYIQGHTQSGHPQQGKPAFSFSWSR